MKNIKLRMLDEIEKKVSAVLNKEEMMVFEEMMDFELLIEKNFTINHENEYKHYLASVELEDKALYNNMKHVLYFYKKTNNKYVVSFLIDFILSRREKGKNEEFKTFPFLDKE